MNRIFLQPKSQQLIERMRKVSHKMNQQILNGLINRNLKSTAQTLGTMKKNLLEYLDEAPE